MKKQNRIIKIDDNFSKIELYFDDDENFVSKNLTVWVIVNSRTFTGRYKTVISKDIYKSFAKNISTWKKQVDSGKFEKKLIFISNNEHIIFEIQAINPNKISWFIKLKPFLPDIETLLLKIETELNLINSLERVLKLF